VHGEAVAASSPPGDTAGRCLPYDSADSYGPIKQIRYTLDGARGGCYLSKLTLGRRPVWCVMHARATGDVLLFFLKLYERSMGGI
jgi:hypothetical protein